MISTHIFFSNSGYYPLLPGVDACGDNNYQLGLTQTSIPSLIPPTSPTSSAGTTSPTFAPGTTTETVHHSDGHVNKVGVLLTLLLAILAI